MSKAKGKHVSAARAHSSQRTNHKQTSAGCTAYSKSFPIYTRSVDAKQASAICKKVSIDFQVTQKALRGSFKYLVRS